MTALVPKHHIWARGTHSHRVKSLANNPMIKLTGDCSALQQAQKYPTFHDFLH